MPFLRSIEISVMYWILLFQLAIGHDKVCFVNEENNYQPPFDLARSTSRDAVTTKLPKRKDKKGREKTQKVKMQPALALSLLSLASLIVPLLSSIEDVPSRELRTKRSFEDVTSNRFSARVPCGRCVHPPCGRCGLTLVRWGFDVLMF